MQSSSRANYLASAGAAADLVGRIGDGWWDRPGLGGWDLRALVGHTSRAVVTVLTYVNRPAARLDLETPESYYVQVTRGAATDAASVTARGVAAGEEVGPRPATAFRDLVEQLTATLAQFADDALIETIAGGMRLDGYLVTRTFELVVHGYDIARATGLPYDPPTGAAADACALAGRIAAETGRAETLLMGLTGRTSLGDGFSVV